MNSKNKITKYKAVCEAVLREYINKHGYDAHLSIIINSIYGKFPYEQRKYQNNSTIKRRIPKE